jgi:hypothetical protein
MFYELASKLEPGTLVFIPAKNEFEVGIVIANTDSDAEHYRKVVVLRRSMGIERYDIKNDFVFEVIEFD